MDFSLEFFPPKAYLSSLKLSATLKELRVLLPKFITITKTKSSDQNQFDVISTIRSEFNSVAPHILCGQVAEEVHESLKNISKIGADRLVILKGDRTGCPDNLDLGAVRNFISLVCLSYGNLFTTEVAAYPDCHPHNPLPHEDVRNLLSKIKYGASSAITQYFYVPDSFYNLLERVQEVGVSLSITPGIMPVISLTQTLKFSVQCGSDIPHWIMRRLEELNSNEAIIYFGMMMITCLYINLIGNGIRDFHIYTLNNNKIIQGMLMGKAEGNNELD